MAKITQICVPFEEYTDLNTNTAIFTQPASGKCFLLSALLLFSALSVHCQDFLVNIDRALRQGNAKNLEVYFDNNIDLSFSEKTVSYPRKQAEAAIQKFFTQVEPKDFTKVNKGTSQANNTIYYIGTLSTSSGSYQVYMLFVFKNAAYVIKELRFEKV
jgi:hypothetical protein